LQNLRQWGKEKLTSEELNNKLLICKDSEERAVWHLADGNGKQTLLQKLCVWRIVALIEEELRNTFFANPR
jgi:hypothetical protein